MGILMQGDPLVKENQFYYETPHTRNLISLDYLLEKLWRTPWIMLLIRGELLGLAIGEILELCLEEVLDICIEEVHGLFLKEILGLLLGEILEYFF